MRPQTPRDDAKVAITCPDLSKPTDAAEITTFTAEWDVAALRSALGDLLTGAGACARLVPRRQLPPSDDSRRWVATTVSADEHTPRSADKPMLKALAGLIAATAAADLDEINTRAMVPLLFLVVSILGRSLGVIPGTDPVSAGASVSIVPVDLPPGAGIGSSAALCVAAAGALLGAVCDSTAADGDTGAEGAGAAGWAPQEALQRLINEWAFMGEQVIHGNPSGLDNTVSCFGGAMAYAKEPKVRACASVTLWQLPQL